MKIISQKSKFLIKLSKLEPFYFYFFLILNLLPVLCFKFFPTVDGPAHLYNSKIIVELFANSNSPINQYFSFNTTINPNWSGHFILSTSLKLFPAFIAEKIILLIYLLGLPLSIRSLLNTYKINNKYLIYFIFPFTYSYLFYFGFYNFNIGLVFLFYGISYWIRYCETLNFKRILLLTALSLAICMSHLFIFIFYLFIIFILNTESFIYYLKHKKENIHDFFKRWFFQFICIFPGLLITINFAFTASETKTTSTYLSFKELITSLKYIMPMKGIDYDGYNITSRILLYVFVLFFIYYICQTIYNYSKFKTFTSKNNIWGVLSLLTLILVFILPDFSYVSVGFISSRLILLFFIFTIIWIASQELPIWLKVILFLTINSINYTSLSHNYKSISTRCAMAKAINDLSLTIKPNSTILPINLSSEKLFTHISNYLGIDKPMIILENYEATLDHFPIKWVHNKRNDKIRADGMNLRQISTILNHEKTFQDIDYIFILKDKTELVLNSSITDSFKLILKNEYDKIQTGSPQLELYKNKWNH